MYELIIFYQIFQLNTISFYLKKSALFFKYTFVLLKHIYVYLIVYLFVQYHTFEIEIYHLIKIIVN